MKKNIVLLSLAIILVLGVGLFMFLNGSQNEEAIESFKIEAKALANKFDQESLDHDDYHFTSQYKLGLTGYVVIADEIGKIIEHPNHDNNGRQIPIPELVSAIEVAGDEDQFLTYEFNGEEKMAYVHKSGQVYLIVLNDLK